MPQLLYSVLSIDGGGIRGIIPSMLLMEIEKRTGKPISSLFDLIAGTSTGGILASGLSVPKSDGTPLMTASEILEFYAGPKSKKIFKKKFGALSNARILFRSIFPGAPMEAALQEEFGDARLKDTLTDLLITSYNTQEKAPFYFRTSQAKIDPNEDFPIRDVVRATSAAPTYFPPKWVKYSGMYKSQKVEELSLIDGGVFANNPSVLAYVEALQKYKESDHYKMQAELMGDEDDDGRGMMATAGPDNHATPFLMISLGTGSSGKKYPYEKAKNWGIKWLMPLIDILMQGVSESVHYQMQYLLPDYIEDKKRKPRYYRFNVKIDPSFSDMSDVSDKNINGLIAYGKEMVEEHDAEIQAICDMLMDMIRRKEDLKMMLP